MEREREMWRKERMPTGFTSDAPPLDVGRAIEQKRKARAAGFPVRGGTMMVCTGRRRTGNTENRGVGMALIDTPKFG